MASSSMSHSRGKNWSESDSLILICISIRDVFKRRYEAFCGRNSSLAGESSSILNDQIAAKFLASSPMVTSRSTDSIKERWIKMVATYRYLPLFFRLIKRHICDWHAGRLVGSMGQPRWFEVEKHVQKKSLGKKVFAIT